MERDLTALSQAWVGGVNGSFTNLGCSVKQVYEVKQLDTDYFNEE